MTQNKKGTAAPTVSIGMPVYNGEKYICEALDSVVAQTYQDFEVIVSDNASNDKTKAICADYCERDSRIKYFRQDQNLGGHWNFNFVVQKANGSMFTWLAHDDILEPNFLEKAVEYMSGRPKIVLVTGDFEIIGDDGERLDIEKLEKIREHIEWNKRCVEFFKYPISNVYFCIYGVMKSDTCKSILQSLQEPKVMAGSELPILARFAVAGEIASIPAVLRKYRRHSASIYMSELTERSKKSMLHKGWISIGNLYGLRYEQMAVLLSSTLSPGLKYTIVIKMLFSYLISFVCRMRRNLLRLFRFLGLKTLFLRH
jgi:glycosyltransferase involved in cell wall biosynthesis